MIHISLRHPIRRRTPQTPTRNNRLTRRRTRHRQRSRTTRCQLIHNLNTRHRHIPGISHNKRVLHPLTRTRYRRRRHTLHKRQPRSRRNRHHRIHTTRHRPRRNCPTHRRRSLTRRGRVRINTPPIHISLRHHIRRRTPQTPARSHRLTHPRTHHRQRTTTRRNPNIRQRHIPSISHNKQVAHTVTRTRRCRGRHTLHYGESW